MTTAPLGTRLSVRSRPVRSGSVAEGALLDLLPGPRGVLSWVCGGEGLVGWGEVASVRTSGPDRFRRAEAWWRAFVDRLDVRDDVGLPGSGAIAFTSLAFADTGVDSVLTVPRVVIGRRGGTTWVTEVDGGFGAEAVSPVRAPKGLRFSSGELDVETWRTAVRTAAKRMRAGVLDKVVLAHDLLARADEPLDPRFLLRGLATRYPSCWVFAVDGLVGATPELLLRRSGRGVSSKVLAGTAWPRDGHDADAVGAELLASEKNLGEHRYAVESFTDALRPYCAELHAPPKPHVMQLPNLSHLASDVSGELGPGGATLLELAAAVHPTAAVGGTPPKLAADQIALLEPMDRGRFAGPVGWVDGNGDGELGLALRCAQLSGPTARLFAGCGIVADSDPDVEVAEAAAKLQPIRQALTGPQVRP